MSKATALLARVSTEGQRDRHTIESQKRVLPGIAGAWKLPEPYRWYVDDGISGARMMERPAMQRLAADIKAGDIHAIVMVDQDRLGRPDDLGDWQQVKNLFKTHGVRLYSASGEIDLASIDGEFTADLHAILGRRERQKIRERAERGRERARDEGRWLGGRLPAPYHIADGHIIVDELEKRRVLRVLDYLRGHSRAEASRRFRMGQGTVRKMVMPQRLWTYAGFQKSSNDEYIPAVWPGIMQKEWIDQILQQATSSPAYGGNPPKFLLTGLGIFRCSICGHSIGSHTDKRGNGTRKAYYRCNNRACQRRRSVVPMHRVDALVLDACQSVLDRMDIIRKWADKNNNGEAAARLDELGMERKRVSESINRLVTAISEGVITFTDARRQRDKLQISMNAIVQEIESIKATLKTLEFDFPVDDISINDLDAPGQRTTISALVKTISHEPEALHFKWRVPVDANGCYTDTIAIHADIV